MFSILVLVLVGLLAGICWWVAFFDRWDDGFGWMMAGGFLTVVAVVLLVVFTIVILNAVYEQLFDFEELIRLKRAESIYTQKADNLTKQFTTYLAKAYPQHERNIYEKIKPETIDIYLVKYPELRAVESITALVEEIRSLQNDIYDQRLAVAETERNIAVRLKNPWLLTFLIPKDRQE